MRFLHIYLVGYFLLVLGAGLTLWQSGALARFGPLWVVIGAIVAVGLGVLLAATASKSPIAND
jgi:hypothetical protein